MNAINQSLQLEEPLFFQEEIAQLEQERDLKLAKIYQEQAKELQGLVQFEQAEEQGNIAHELRIKVALALYPNLNRDKIELIGAALESLNCYKNYLTLECTLTYAHNLKVSGRAYKLSEWVGYSKDYRNECAWLLKELKDILTDRNSVKDL